MLHFLDLCAINTFTWNECVNCICYSSNSRNKTVSRGLPFTSVTIVLTRYLVLWHCLQSLPDRLPPSPSLFADADVDTEARVIPRSAKRRTQQHQYASGRARVSGVLPPFHGISTLCMHALFCAPHFPSAIPLLLMTERESTRRFHHAAVNTKPHATSHTRHPPPAPITFTI